MRAWRTFTCLPKGEGGPETSLCASDDFLNNAISQNECYPGENQDFFILQIFIYTNKKIFQGFQGARVSRLSVLRDPPELEALPDLCCFSSPPPFCKMGSFSIAPTGSPRSPALEVEMVEVLASELSEDLRSINWPSEALSMRFRQFSQLRANLRIPAAVTWWLSKMYFSYSCVFGLASKLHCLIGVQLGATAGSILGFKGGKLLPLLNKFSFSQHWILGQVWQLAFMVALNIRRNSV